MQPQTIFITVLIAIAVCFACIAVLKLNEKNMQEIEANQKEIDKLTDRINELAAPKKSESEDS